MAIPTAEHTRNMVCLLQDTIKDQQELIRKLKAEVAEQQNELDAIAYMEAMEL